MIWISIFVANAVVLLLEIVGARSLTPFFGSSAEAWAGFIGIVLLGLSLGYWLGGRVADRAQSPRHQSNLLAISLAAAGLAIIATWSASDALAAWASFLIAPLGITAAAATAALALLFVPSVFLAAVSPIAVKLLLHSLDTSASVVGRVSAVAAAGSVLGSLGVGIFLIPYFGSHETILGAGVLVLVLGGVIAAASRALTVVGITALAALIAGSANGLLAPGLGEMVSGTLVADVDSRYGRIIVTDADHALGTTFTRSVRLDPFGIQCGAYMNDGESVPLPGLPYPYSQAFDAALIRVPDPATAVVVGGCNYSYPLHLGARTNATVDVVEIDEAMTQVAEEWFAFVPSERVRPYHEDGRTFFERAAADPAGVRYDVVALDAFNSPLATPFQLLTVEAFTAIRASLSERGVVVFNVIGSINGPGSEHVASVIATMQEVFPSIRLFQINDISGAQIQNLIILAGENVDGEGTMALAEHALTLYPVDLADLPADRSIVLTDNYAPVERLTKSMRDFVLYRRS